MNSHRLELHMAHRRQFRAYMREVHNRHVAVTALESRPESQEARLALKAMIMSLDEKNKLRSMKNLGRPR